MWLQKTEVKRQLSAACETAIRIWYNRNKILARVAGYVDVQLKRKIEVLDAYHAAIHPQPKQPDEQKAGPQRASREKQKRSAKIGGKLITVYRPM